MTDKQKNPKSKYWWYWLWSWSIIRPSKEYDWFCAKIR